MDFIGERSPRFDHAILQNRVLGLRTSLEYAEQALAPPTTPVNKSNVANPIYQHGHYENPQGTPYASADISTNYSNVPNPGYQQNTSYSPEQGVTYPTPTSADQPKINSNGELNVSFARSEVVNAQNDPTGKAN